MQGEFVEGMLSATIALESSNRNELITREIVAPEIAWLENRARLAEALNGNDWSELEWAAKHRREFVAWVDEKQSLNALFVDDLTRVKVSNLAHWGNRGFDALNSAAGIPWRKRRRMKRERKREAQRTGQQA